MMAASDNGEYREVWRIMLPGLWAKDLERPALMDGKKLPSYGDPVSAERERKRLEAEGVIPAGCWLKGSLREEETGVGG